VPGSHLRDVSAEYSGSDDTGLYGGDSIRQTVSSQETHADIALQSQCSHMPTRRSSVSHVSGGRHAQVSYRGGSCQGPAHQEEGTLSRQFPLPALLL
jgi:hypothetical protein